MKQETHSTFNPDQQIKLADGKTVTVKHLKWKDALTFFAMLREKFAGFEADAAQPVGKVMDQIGQFPELAEWLIQHTVDAKEVNLDELLLPDASKLVFKALEVNLGSIAAEVKNFRSRLASAASGDAQPTSSPTLPPSAKP